MSDARSDRLSYIKQVTTDISYYLSLIASIIWLIPFFLLDFNNILVKSMYIGGIAFILVFILLIIYDLWNVFEGIWQIRLDVWYELLNRIAT